MKITIDVSDLELAELRSAIADRWVTLADEAYTVPANEKKWYKTRLSALDDLLARIPKTEWLKVSHQLSSKQPPSRA